MLFLILGIYGSIVSKIQNPGKCTDELTSINDSINEVKVSVR
jgi:hypothetical protein